LDAVLAARGLRKVFPDGTVAVDGVSFEAGRGLTVFMGPNGSGKTTTMRMSVGALRPTAGEVEACGHRVWGPEGWRARACMGYSPQDAPFRDRLTALENLVWYGLVRGIPLGEARRRARGLLELVGLEGGASKKVAELSGGMRRRLAIAASLMGDPEVLVLDEPTSGLDPGARLHLWRLLRRLAGERAVVVSTHIPAEAEEHADRVYIFHRGRVIAEGPPASLIERHAPRARIVAEGSMPERPPSVAGAVLVEWNPGRAVYATSDPDGALPALVEGLLAAGARLERVEVRRPGLAEVYLALTGEAPAGVSGGG